VADDVGPLDPVGVEDAQDVAHLHLHAVGGHVRRSVGGPEAAQVGREHSEARVDQPRDLVAPQRRRVREAVQEEHGGPLALVDDVQVHPVHGDVHDSAPLARVSMAATIR